MLWLIYVCALLPVGKEAIALYKDRCWRDLMVVSLICVTALLLIILKKNELPSPFMWLSQTMKNLFQAVATKLNGGTPV